MSWQEWPEGVETGLNPHICPVCSTPLKPVEIHYISEATYLCREQTTFYTAICPHCRVKYLRTAPVEDVTIDANEDRIIELEDTVKALNARISNLEDVIKKLIAYIQNTRTSTPSKQLPERKPVTEAEDFTRKYHHLL